MLQLTQMKKQDQTSQPTDGTYELAVYDLLADVHREREAMLAVIDSPTVEPQFKLAVRELAALRRRDLIELGHLAAADVLDLDPSHV